MAFTLRQLQFFIAAEYGSVSGTVRALENDHGVVSSHLSDFLFVKILLPEASIGQVHMSGKTIGKTDPPLLRFFYCETPELA